MSSMPWADKLEQRIAELEAKAGEIDEGVIKAVVGWQ